MVYKSIDSKEMKISDSCVHSCCSDFEEAGDGVNDDELVRLRMCFVQDWSFT